MSTEAGVAQKKEQPREPTNELPAKTLLVDEEIRQRAYGIWLRRGQQDGSAEADWLRAEEEILGEAKA